MRRPLQLLLGLILAGVVAAGGFYVWYVRGVGLRPSIVQRPGYEWTGERALPHARTEVTAASVGGKIYVIGGFNGFARATGTVQIYDLAARTWADGPPLPDGVHHAMAAALADRLYVVGGLTRVRFVPTAKVLRLEGVRWIDAATLPEPLGAAGVAILDGKIHVVGGQGPAGDLPAHYVFDPARDRWEQRSAPATARDHLAAAALGGRLYAVGGRLGGDFARNVATVDVYDPPADAWRAAPSLVKARSGHAAVAVWDRILVFGGEERGGTIAPVEAFDGTRWQVVSRMPTPRHGLGAVVIGQDVYLLSGGKRPGLSVSTTNERVTVGAVR